MKATDAGVLPRYQFHRIALRVRTGLSGGGNRFILAPDVSDYEHATAAIRRYETGLRSGDALNLAVAHNNAVLEIATLDRGMARAATMLGLSVATP